IRLGSKTIISPLSAAATVSRNEPAPLSALVRTVGVLGTVRSSSTRSCGTKDRRGLEVRRPGVGDDRRRRQGVPGELHHGERHQRAPRAREHGGAGFRGPVTVTPPTYATEHEAAKARPPPPP